ncbi:MAG: hypothetical protein ACRD26_14645, partial [Vicinamibacterales bacterium]
MRALVLLLLPFCTAIAAAPAYATVYLPADFVEMVTTSTFIVHGRVVDVRSEPTSDRRAIATFVTLDVERSLKGRPGDSITFRVPGGEVGRYRRVIAGAPQFARGDELVLFLSARGPSIPYVFGLSQGVYRVSRAGGRALVTPPPVGAGPRAAGRIVRGDP